MKYNVLKKAKKLLLIAVVFCLLFSLPAMAEVSTVSIYKNAVQIRLNGNYITADNYLYQNQVYLPLRTIAENFGYEIIWNGDERSVCVNTVSPVKADFETVEYTIPTNPITETVEAYTNELKFYLDSKEIVLSHLLINSTTYIPASEFYDLAGCHIYLDQATASVRIYSRDYITFEENEAAFYNGTKLTEEQFNDIAKFIYNGNADAGMQRNYVDVENYLLYNAASFKIATENKLDKKEFDQFLKDNNTEQMMDELQISDKKFFTDVVLTDFYYRNVLSSEKALEIYIPSDEDMIMAFIQSPYSQGHWMKAKHILIEKGENDEGLKTAKDLLSKLKKNPNNFDKLMDEYSKDPGSKTQPDGYLFKEGDMVTEFYEGTLPLKENEISDIVESVYGYHIIQKVADYPEGVPFLELKDELHASYAENAFMQEMLSIIANTDTVLNHSLINR